MFESTTYERRRQALREKVQSGIILLLGNNEAPANYPDNCYKYRQDSSFLYFFGQSHPGYAGILDIEAGEDIFFGNDVDIDDIIWMGPQPSIKDLAAQHPTIGSVERRGVQGYRPRKKSTLPPSLPLRQHDVVGRTDWCPCFRS